MASGSAPDDDELFLEAMSGVDALPDRQRVPAGAPAAPGRAASRPPPIAVEGRVGRSKGVNDRQLADLAAGRIAVERRIDLHGLRADPARHAIERDLARAAADRLKCVLVVHGKGTHSGGAAVLGDLAVEVMRRPPSARHVLAFCPAQPRDGGEGALYVLVRRARKPR